MSLEKINAITKSSGRVTKLNQLVSAIEKFIGSLEPWVPVNNATEIILSSITMIEKSDFL